MADFDELRLAELMCARLCHDLSGPIGAVATGAELAADPDAGEMGADALALLGESAQAAVRRLKFLRQALGAGEPPAGDGELRGLCADFLAASANSAGALNLEWQSADGNWTGKSKLLLNLVMVARDGLPRGGTVTVSATPTGFTVTAAGRGATPGEAAAALKAATPDGLGPRAVQAFYAARLARVSGAEIVLEAGDDRLTLAARVKTSG